MAIQAIAPLRILDIGTWTDTAAAEHGAGLGCAINRYVRVVVRPRTRHGAAVHLRGRLHGACQQAGPTLQAFAQAALRYFNLDGVDAWIDVPLPPGYGAGVLAAAATACTAALATLAQSPLPPLRLAALAHRLFHDEAQHPGGMLGFLTAALGGVHFFRLDPFPRVFADPVVLPVGAQSLAERLLLVITGRQPTRQAAAGIDRRCLEGDRDARAVVWQLRALPARAREALSTGDDAALSEILQMHTALQRRMAPALISPEVQRIDTLARAGGASALKVNGDGGSVTVLVSPHCRTGVLHALQQAGYAAMPVCLARHGVRVWSDAADHLVLPVVAVAAESSARAADGQQVKAGQRVQCAAGVDPEQLDHHHLQHQKDRHLHAWAAD